MQALRPTFRDQRAKRDEDPITGMPRLVALEDIITIDEAIRLYIHLHNGNGLYDFGMAFRDRDGKAVHVRSQKASVEKIIPWSIATSFRKGPTSKPIAFMAYPRNPAGETCWGALDFDAHDGNRIRARDLAFKAWNHIRQIRPNLCVILETSDSGGWHVWIIKEKPLPCQAVSSFLKEVAEAIGAEIRRGICEIFPHR